MNVSGSSTDHELPGLGAPPVHGGADALGVPPHDLSTNANACGPCPQAVQALAMADARPYPDPAYTALRARLAAWHGVAPARIHLAASASEFIQRISVAVALQAAGRSAAPGMPATPVTPATTPAMWQPAHAYGDYARAAQAAGLARTPQPAQAALLWACEPSSPLGQPQAGLADMVAALAPGQTLVLDEAYAPLRLHGAPSLGPQALARVWRLITPNKALALTGVRAAYAIAPAAAETPAATPDTPAAALAARLAALSPSWPVGAHGVALLQAWTTAEVQDWLAACRRQLRQWQARQRRWLQADGWRTQPSEANFFVATPPAACPGATTAAPIAAPTAAPASLAPQLHALRQHGFKLRDCASFGLPGHVRMAVAPPSVQDRLRAALRTVWGG